MAYARDLPIDRNNNLYPAPPAYISNQSQNGVPAASSVVTLNDKTTVLMVMAMGGNAGNAGIIGKWGSASVTGNNFDFMVNSGQTTPLVVPVSVMGGVSSVAGANVVNGLYQTVALKTATAQSCSVFTSEY